MPTPRGAVGVRVDGVPRVVAALAAIGVDVNDLKDAFAEIARQGASLAAQYAPVRTGRLAGDIRGNRSRSKATITAGRVSVPYAGAINYGWAAHGIEPSGFMQRADAEVQDYAVQRLEDDINAAIRKRGMQ
jgi:hypothetical protein